MTKSIVAKRGLNLLAKVPVNVRLGILHTIANSIYASTPRKIREAAANAMDNRASWMVIYADPSTRSLVLFDNGHGITPDRFAEVFQNLGYGLLKHEEGKLSYFGLGLMSVFQLGGRVKLFTRPAGQSEMYVLEVDTNEVFASENEDKPIAFLADHVRLRSADDFVRASCAAPVLNDKLLELFGALPDSFTEIVIEDVNKADMDEICSEGFSVQLRQLLPLRAEDGEPFLKRFKDPTKAKLLREILEDSRFCPTIDTYFGTAGEKDLVQLWKYFPEFRRELAFGAADMLVGICEEHKFAYYIVHTTEDLERRQKEESETGFWIRNRNFLVKSADFFEYPGSRKRYISEPLKNWMFGEIFHANMNDILSVARDDYLWQTHAFQEFRDAVVGIVDHLNRDLRRYWQEKKRVVESLIEPFEKFGSPGGALRRTEDVLRTMEGTGDEDDKSFRERMLRKLSQKRTLSIENPAHRVDVLLRSTSQPIVLADDEGVVVEIDPNLSDEGRYRSIFEPSKKQIVVSLSPKLFQPLEVVFLGKTFTVVYVAEKENAPGVSVNVEKGTIYVNPFNHDLKAYTISFLDVYIAVLIAEALAANKEEMKHYLLRILGRESVSVAKYMTPLENDLMRKRRAR